MSYLPAPSWRVALAARASEAIGLCQPDLLDNTSNAPESRCSLSCIQHSSINTTFRPPSWISTHLSSLAAPLPSLQGTTATAVPLAAATASPHIRPSATYVQGTPAARDQGPHPPGGPCDRLPPPPNHSPWLLVLRWGTSVRDSDGAVPSGRKPCRHAPAAHC
jgi:hypothetical protein